MHSVIKTELKFVARCKTSEDKHVTAFEEERILFKLPGNSDGSVDLAKMGVIIFWK